MNRTGKVTVVLFLLALLSFSCAPRLDTGKPPPSAESKESLFNRGHLLYAEQKYDSAQVYLEKAVALDAGFIAPVNNLAQMHYDMGMRLEGDKNPMRLKQLRQSFAYYAKTETMGGVDSELYERLCELSVILEDDKSFLKYAKKNVENYPYDRQYYNLGLAYFNVGDYATVIKVQKEAVEKFKSSQYVGSYYRQIGRAYMMVDRDQTAERTFDIGIKAVNGNLDQLRKAGNSATSMPEYRRLMDDKIGMLVLLRKLHQTYKAWDKLEQVQRQLKEAGYTK